MRLLLLKWKDPPLSNRLPLGLFKNGLTPKE